MKTMTFTLSLLFSAGCAAAGHDRSVLHLDIAAREDVYGHTVYMVSLDGATYKSGTNSVHMEEVLPGLRLLRVSVRRLHPYTHRVMASRVLFYGYVQIAPASELFAAVEPGNRFMIHRAVPLFAGTVPHCTNTINGGSWNDGACRFSHMHPDAFVHLKYVISERWSDAARISVMEQAMRQHHLTAPQVRELLLMLDFESNRLFMAKHAWLNTCDRQAFYVVFEVFDFDASVHELTSFMHRNG